MCFCHAQGPSPWGTPHPVSRDGDLGNGRRDTFSEWPGPGASGSLSLSHAAPGPGGSWRPLGGQTSALRHRPGLSVSQAHIHVPVPHAPAPWDLGPASPPGGHGIAIRTLGSRPWGSPLQPLSQGIASRDPTSPGRPWGRPANHQDLAPDPSEGRGAAGRGRGRLPPPPGACRSADLPVPAPPPPRTALTRCPTARPRGRRRHCNQPARRPCAHPAATTGGVRGRGF